MTGWRTQVSLAVGGNGPTLRGLWDSPSALERAGLEFVAQHITPHALPSVSELPEPKYHRALGGLRATFYILYQPPKHLTQRAALSKAELL